MSDQQTFFTRIGSWFRRGARNGDLPLQHETAIEPRSTFLRPWAGQRAAISRLQDSFDSLTELMGSIRENLDRQAKRQDELLNYLSHLPEALRSIPESSRIHGETLKAIHQQLEHQNLQQEKLGEILNKLSEGGTESREALGEIQQRVEAIRETDAAISANLSSLGSALQSVSHTSAAGAQVLDQMCNRLDARDGQLERILQRQGTRFTTMLSIAIFLSVAAVVAVSVIGYLLIVRP